MRNTLHPDRAFVHVDELTRQVQTDPRPRHIVLVTGKETVKDGSNIFRRNAFAIIFASPARSCTRSLPTTPAPTTRPCSTPTHPR